jgi:hypothetical protein
VLLLILPVGLFEGILSVPTLAKKKGDCDNGFESASSRIAALDGAAPSVAEPISIAVALVRTIRDAGGERSKVNPSTTNARRGLFLRSVVDKTRSSAAIQQSSQHTWLPLPRRRPQQPRRVVALARSRHHTITVVISEPIGMNAVAGTKQLSTAIASAFPDGRCVWAINKVEAEQFTVTSLSVTSRLIRGIRHLGRDSKWIECPSANYPSRTPMDDHDGPIEDRGAMT